MPLFQSGYSCQPPLAASDLQHRPWCCRDQAVLVIALSAVSLSLLAPPLQASPDSRFLPPEVRNSAEPPPPRAAHGVEIRRVLLRDGNYFEPQGERRRLSAHEREILRRELRESMHEVHGQPAGLKLRPNN